MSNIHSLAYRGYQNLNLSTRTPYPYLNIESDLSKSSLIGTKSVTPIPKVADLSALSKILDKKFKIRRASRSKIPGSITAPLKIKSKKSLPAASYLDITGPGPKQSISASYMNSYDVQRVSQLLNDSPLESLHKPSGTKNTLATISKANELVDIIRSKGRFTRKDLEIIPVYTPVKVSLEPIVVSLCSNQNIYRIES